eukprot:5256-Heterococcus_DN1.PRE.1
MDSNSGNAITAAALSIMISQRRMASDAEFFTMHIGFEQSHADYKLDRCAIAVIAIWYHCDNCCAILRQSQRSRLVKQVESVEASRERRNSSTLNNNSGAELNSNANSE